MAEISVINTDWEIIEDLDDALTAVTLDGDKVFQSVTIATSRGQARDVQLRGGAPRVIIRYVGTTENESPEDWRGCAVAVEFLIAAKVTRAADEHARIKEILRLVNVVKNTVETTPPADAVYWGDRDYWHAKLQWGIPEIDTRERQFWTVAMLPLEVSYVITATTSH